MWNYGKVQEMFQPKRATAFQISAERVSIGLALDAGIDPLTEPYQYGRWHGANSIEVAPLLTYVPSEVSRYEAGWLDGAQVLEDSIRRFQGRL